MKKLLTLVLLGAITFQPLWAFGYTPVSGKTAQPLSLFRKKNAPVKPRPTPGLFGRAELPSAIHTGDADSAELGWFIPETCVVKKTRDLPGRKSSWAPGNR